MIVDKQQQQHEYLYFIVSTILISASYSLFTSRSVDNTYCQPLLYLFIYLEGIDRVYLLSDPFQNNNFNAVWYLLIIN